MGPKIQNKLDLRILVFLLCLFTIQAHQVSKFSNIIDKSGQISYFDIIQQPSRHQNTLDALKSNVTFRNDVNKIFTEMKQVRMILEGNNLEDYLQLLQTDDPSRLLSQTKVAPSQCVNDTGRMIVELFKKKREPWAGQMLDSIGKPGPSLTEGRLNFVGNYRQCRSAVAPPDSNSKGFSGEYTVVTLYTAAGAWGAPVGLSWGLCFPDTCDPIQIYLLANETLTALNFTSGQLGLPEIRNDEREFTSATYAAIVIMSVIVFMMLIGTTYDVIYIQKFNSSTNIASVNDIESLPNEKTGNGYGTYHNNAQKGVSDSIRETTPITQKHDATNEAGTLTKVLLSFSVYTNTTKFLNTTQPKGSLGAIHGIRFLSMSWVILGHIYAFGMNSFVNSSDQLIFIKRWTFDGIANAFPSVDTFFTLSGLLTAYLTVREIKKRGPKINWGLFYFHRFWRLTPPYMLTLLLVLGLQRFLGSGALWASVQPADKTFCEKNWWTNLLYVNNLVNNKEQCFGHAWYLANDMQFFVISPLMIIPFYFSATAGLASCSFFLLIHWVTTGVISTTEEWPATAFGIGEKNTIDYFMHYYITPWCRIGPYIVGLAVGGIMATKKLHLTQMTNLIGWAIATATGLAVVYGIHDEITEGALSVGVSAFYNAVSRSAWGACVCWVIVSCVNGHGGLVGSFLSWSPFVSLGRLTYMAYLIHPCILNTYFANMDQLFFANNMNVAVSYIGIVVLANMSAFVLMLGLESPMIGLEKAILPRK